MNETRKPKYVTVRIPNKLLDYIDKQVGKMSRRGITQRDIPRTVLHTKAEVLSGAVKLGVRYLKSERRHSLGLFYAARPDIEESLQYSIAVAYSDWEVLRNQALMDKEAGVRVPGWHDKIPTVTDMVLACAVSYYDEVITQMALE